MAVETQAHPAQPSRRHRWRSWLALGLMGAVLTFVGLAIATGGQPLIGLFQRREGLSDDNFREITDVKKLGGEAHFLDRSPVFLGPFGGRDLIDIGIHGKPFGDESLAGSTSIGQRCAAPGSAG